MLDGKPAERMFFDIMKQDHDVQWASREEDMYQHFDVIVDGIKYDVKGEKKLNRSDSTTSDIVWLELMNVRGREGWLMGKADKIAFQKDQSFLIVDREKLYNFVKNFVTTSEILDYKKYKGWYRRKGRKDIITYVYFQDIDHLVEKEIKYGTS